MVSGASTHSTGIARRPDASTREGMSGKQWLTALLCCATMLPDVEILFLLDRRGIGLKTRFVPRAEGLLASAGTASVALERALHHNCHYFFVSRPCIRLTTSAADRTALLVGSWKPMSLHFLYGGGVPSLASGTYAARTPSFL